MSLVSQPEDGLEQFTAAPTRERLQAQSEDGEDGDGSFRSVLSPPPQCFSEASMEKTPIKAELSVQLSATKEVFGTTPKRFVVLAIFSIYAFINQVQYVTFSMIIRETEQHFHVSSMEVNILSILVPVVYCVAVIPGCLFYNTVGLRWGMIAGGTTNAIGSLFKFIAVWSPDYPLVVVAQVFVALGQVLFLSLPPLVASRWFPVDERTVATAISSLFGFAGMAVGMFYSPRVVSLPDKAGTDDWATLMGSQFGISMGVLILMLFLVPEKPALPPSLTAANEGGDTHLWTKLRRQFRCKNVMVLTISFGLVAGTLTAVAALLTQILEPFGISESKAGILAFAGILGGAANCGIVGFAVDRARRYKIPMLILTAIVAGLLLVITILVKCLHSETGFAVAAYIIVPLLEFLVLPLVPVAMELSVELTFPDPESVSSTLVLLSMCFFSFVGMVVFSIILGDHPTKNLSFAVVVVALVVCAVSLLGLCFVHEDLRRLNHEKPLQAFEHESVASSTAPLTPDQSPREQSLFSSRQLSVSTPCPPTTVFPAEDNTEDDIHA